MRRLSDPFTVVYTVLTNTVYTYSSTCEGPLLLLNADRMQTEMLYLVLNEDVIGTMKRMRRRRMRT